MTRPAFAALLIVCGATSFVVGAEHRLNNQTFTLPDGFAIELIAGPPLSERPITAAFDERGRLYVAESSGSNDNVQTQLRERPHKILRLEDADGDGKFDHRTVFADKMMLPEGTMWLEGSLYVAAPPSIWKLTDTNDDGVADERVEWFKGKTLTGCANDLHGPYAGPDGWIYWCKGAFAEQTYDRPGRKPLVTKASHIFRARPDGSGIEAVMTGGMDNPVDVAFTPGGERIFTTTFLQNPGGGKRDGLIHAIYGGVYGKIHNVIENHPQTGEVMPVLSHLGAAAPCGLTAYQSNAFGEGYTNNLFAALFNMHKITRHVLSTEGAGLKSKDEDFLVSDSLDFHPTDVLEDADGSLIVVDTGGWYKLCCPTSQLAKPDVIGGIYRVRKVGAAKVEDPRGQALKWADLSPLELSKLLGDARPAVRERAIAELAKRGAEGRATAPGVRLNSSSPLARRSAVWVLARMDHADARAAVRLALEDQDLATCQAALHSISLWRDKEAVPRLTRLLGASPSSVKRRMAAEALGRIGDKTTVPALLAAAEKANDRTLEHAITFALIEINAPAETAAGLTAASTATRRAALVALSEMENGDLTPALVTKLLTSDDAKLKETAAWIVSRHSEWGEALASYLQERLAAQDLSEPELAQLGQQLAKFASAPAVQQLLGAAVADDNMPPARRHAALAAMARAGGNDVPSQWPNAILTALSSGNVPLMEQAIATARSLPRGRRPSPQLGEALAKLANQSTGPARVRIAAAAAMPPGPVSAELFALLLEQLKADAEVAQRSAAVDVLTTAPLTKEQLAEVALAFGGVGPLEANRLLAAFEKSEDEAVGLKLVTTIKASPVVGALRADALQKALEKSPASVKQAAGEIYQKLEVNVAQQAAQLETLRASLPAGDIRRGQAIFHSKKTACFACHAMGYLGGNIGPDLTQIGRIRADKDLLESIVFPSASFVRSYEPVVVTTQQGTVHSGNVRQDSAAEMVLAIAADKEVRIPRADVEDVTSGRVSIMPAGLDKQLSVQELADLVEYLKAAK